MTCHLIHEEYQTLHEGRFFLMGNTGYIKSVFGPIDLATGKYTDIAPTAQVAPITPTGAIKRACQFWEE